MTPVFGHRILRDFHSQGQHILLLQVRCIECKTQHGFRVSFDGYTRWRNGATIQHALPELNASQRELLISATCGPCYDNLFSMPETFLDEDYDEPAF